MWEVTDSSDTTVELQMKPSDYTKAIWDKVNLVQSSFLGVKGM
jgi:hypothetical protein